LALGLSLVLGWGFPAQAAEGKCYKRNYTFNFLAENDLWGSGSDKHFTHGTRLSFVESREKGKVLRFAIRLSWTWVLSARNHMPKMFKNGCIKIFPTRPSRRSGTISSKTNREFYSTWSANGVWN
jgi:hypothetical protein